MTGQADAADSIEGLASFLGGEPEEAHEEENEAESQPDEGVGENEDASDEPEADEESEEEGEEAEGQTSDLVEVTVKGEDGTETTEKVTVDELKSGYMRQKAFTQKTMELADRERQAAEVVQQRVTEARQYAMQQQQMAKAAIAQLAGLRSEDELAQLATSDPAAWVQETQRMRAVNGFLQQLDSQIQAEQAQLQQQQQKSQQEQISKAWEVLTAKGITRDKLADMYGKLQKDYQVSAQQLGTLLDPAMVDVVKDALAYRDLQNKKPQINNKVKEAERLPAQKKSLPASERQHRALNDRFKGGRAKTNDLAAFIASNKI